MDEDYLKKEIRKFALKNSIEHEGKANEKAIIGSVMGAIPEARENPQMVASLTQDSIVDINKLPLDEQEKELKETAPELTEKKETKKKEGLKPLPNAEKGRVIMRIAPSPSGPMHIGHAMTYGVSSEYCRMYNGKLILRIEDTNPDNIYVPAYEMLEDEAQWLTGNNVKEVIVQSERLPLYYDYVEKFIDKSAAYVCTCDPEEYKQKLNRQEACQCRELPAERQRKRWEKMLSNEGYKPGDAVVRLKTDINHKNPAMRDFPLARINEAEHPRQGRKFRVWPLMNLSVFVDDIESGMTHVIRGKDHADNAKRQEIMYNYLGKEAPATLFQGRVNFEDIRLSCSKTKKLIEEGEYTGWDDIRLAFLAALRRRGYQSQALVRWATDIGTSLTDKTVSKDEVFKTINAHNRDILEPDAKRFYFVDQPVKIKVEGAPSQEVELDLHPDNIKGGRKFRTNENFIVTKHDYEKMAQGRISRLMDCLNYVHESERIAFDSLEYEKYKEKGCCRIIHWLPDDDEQVVDAEVSMPDGTITNGKAEKTIEMLKAGDVIQFERFGFCRLDSVEDGCYKFWFCHK